MRCERVPRAADRIRRAYQHYQRGFCLRESARLLRRVAAIGGTARIAYRGLSPRESWRASVKARARTHARTKSLF